MVTSRMAPDDACKVLIFSYGYNDHGNKLFDVVTILLLLFYQVQNIIYFVNTIVIICIKYLYVFINLL